MIEMMLSDVFYYQVPWTHIWLNSLQEFNRMFYFWFTQGLFPYGIEVFSVILVLLILVVNFRQITKVPFISYSFILSIILLAIVSNAVPVSWFAFLDFIQFPWRLYMFIDFFFAILLAFGYQQLKDNIFKKLSLIIFVLMMTVNYLTFTTYYIQDRFKEYMYTDFVRYAFEGWEFVPSSVDLNALKDQQYTKSVTASNDLELSFTRKVDGYIFTFDQNEFQNTVVNIPLIYYKGYDAYYMGEQGEGFLEIYKNDQSLISVNLGTMKSGSVKVFFNGLFTQKIGNLISILSVLTIVLLLVKSNFRLLFDKFMFKHIKNR